MEVNNSHFENISDLMVHQIFEFFVVKHPEAIAITCKGEQLTYQDLDIRSNRLAHHLQNLGVRPETLVGVCLERSLDVLISWLAVLKAGGAFVPLDPNIPLALLTKMVEDANFSLAISSRSLKLTVSEWKTAIVYLDDLKERYTPKYDLPVISEVQPSNLAYVIFTSGTTGKPKGVLHEHRSLANFILNFSNVLNIGETCRMLQFSSVSFDTAIAETFTALGGGGRLCVATHEEQLSIPALTVLINNQEINTAILTPSLLSILPEYDLKGLTWIISRGEACTPEILKTWSPDRVFFNSYGNSEAGIAVTLERVNQNDLDRILSIGHPLRDYCFYILDRFQQPVSTGESGELCIAGMNLARGYLNLPDLTTERFINSPFLPTERIYRTGDLVCHKPDGHLEYLGRIEQEIKLNNVRFDPGKIETALTLYPGITQAAVIVREKSAAEMQIEAYLLLAKGMPQPSLIDLRAHAMGLLPNDIIPGKFIFLEHMPRTLNAKIDRNALHKILGKPVSEEESITPRNRTVEIIMTEWRNIFGIERVGIEDNFFDLGGHSLLVMRLVARLRMELNIEIPLSTVFDAPTVGGLAEQVELIRNNAEKSTLPDLEQVQNTEHYPLSYSQQSLWLVDRLEPGSNVYYETKAYILEGSLDCGALERAINQMVRRHEALRTRFTVVDGQPVQVIDAEMMIPLDISNLASYSNGERQRLAQELLEVEIERPFDLEKGPLLRTSLIKMGEVEHTLVLTMHHIIMDGWSLGVIEQELSKLYSAEVLGEPPKLHELIYQYVDYTMWQRKLMQGAFREKQLSYWRERLDRLQELEIPTILARPVSRTHHGSITFFQISSEIARGIKEICKKEESTLYMVLLSAFNVLLFRYTNTDDIAVGTGVANRRQTEIEELIGFFVNMVIMRNDLSGNPTFLELLKRVRETTLEAYTHQDLPFEILVDELNPERVINRNPLFQVAFELQSAQTYPLTFPGIKAKEKNLITKTTKFDLTLFIEEKGELLQGSFEYSTDLFDSEMIDRMVGHLIQILKGIVKDPKITIENIQMLTERELDQILREWNQTDTEYPRDSSVQAEFERQVERTPNKVALVHGEEKVSYRELNERANQLGHYLVDHGVEMGSLIGICVERSVDLIVGLLGILKAGGAYLPLEPTYPEERLRFMLEESQSRLVITEERLADKLPQFIQKVLTLDRDWEQIGRCETSNLEVKTEAEDLAYVMYTSGSTGKPKGVCVTHRGIVRLVKSQNYLDFNSDEVFIQFSNIAFDASTFEIWGSLLNGARLILFPAYLPSLTELGNVINENGVTTVLLTAGLFHQMVEMNIKGLFGVRHLLAGGDVLSPKHVRLVLEQLTGCTMINAYGPTENATITTCYVMNRSEIKWKTVPIGRPISNTRVYILDRHQQPVPVGVIGELYTGGDGLAIGYLRQPDRTSERFIPDPFSSMDGERLYKTGDFARYLPDGCIEFLGRIDNQVKIRGFRIELGEIEAVIESNPAVQSVVVEVKEMGAIGKSICAYIVLKPGETQTSADIKGFLKDRLPDYMLPSSYIFLDSFPLNPNGKVDRLALSNPERSETDLARTYLPPATPIEDQLIYMWKEVLGLDKIGVNNNFFELGGNSILASRLFASIEAYFGKRLPMRILFNNPTIAQLADVISRENISETWPSLVTIKDGGSKPAFYCVHTLGGMVGTYYLLAKYLDDEQPVYGVHSQWENEEEKIFSTIEETASYCMQKIMTYQPQGPYYLGGYSFGGMVAYEIARQIRLQGSEVALLALFDTLPNLQSLPLLLRIRQKIRNYAMHVEYHKNKLNQISFRRYGDYLLPILRKSLETKKGWINKSKHAQPQTNKVNRTEAVIQINLKAHEQYHYKPAPLRVTLFKAQQAPLSDTFHAPPYGWQYFALKGVDVQNIHGGHADILSLPYVGELAKVLQTCINRAIEDAKK